MLHFNLENLHEEVQQIGVSYATTFLRQVPVKIETSLFASQNNMTVVCIFVLIAKVLGNKLSTFGGISRIMLVLPSTVSH